MCQPIPSRDASDSQTKLSKLAETYATRVRELSDAVAKLGRRIAAREQINEDIRNVRRLRALAEQASENLLGALESPQSRTSAA